VAFPPHDATVTATAMAASACFTMGVRRDSISSGSREQAGTPSDLWPLRAAHPQRKFVKTR
jgi:hypothetical protein